MGKKSRILDFLFSTASGKTVLLIPTYRKTFRCLHLLHYLQKKKPGSYSKSAFLKFASAHTCRTREYQHAARIHHRLHSRAHYAPQRSRRHRLVSFIVFSLPVATGCGSSSGCSPVLRFTLPTAGTIASCPRGTKIAGHSRKLVKNSSGKIPRSARRPLPLFARAA